MLLRLCLPTLVALLGVSTAIPSEPPVADPHAPIVKRQRLEALPQRAGPEHINWQPSLDFDRDSCYHVPMIDAAGNVNAGQDQATAHCRQGWMLSNTNVYVRGHCETRNNVKWCIQIYDYYFEADGGQPPVGHRHDIEHIAVVFKNNNFERISVSCHGKWDSRGKNNVIWHDGGSHAKIVYHKDGGGTRCFRYATANDEPPENHAGHWFRGALVDWFQGLNNNQRNILNSHSFEPAGLAIRDSKWWCSITAVIPELRNSGDCQKCQWKGGC
ncbi:necrosis inducing protein-domain-containing protein [Paraphoma chrysanthemicola]|uniref:Necrosis inducing protein-domain-containing protein n=1 Tax=Paraphoma chrysanthemicola TaxID=798071 RepID=A0A8K0RJV3_9PLEO|nr:necrosis inducing protein-domain-containing protein [Paraphoma chrysanthemicola]